MFMSVNVNIELARSLPIVKPKPLVTSAWPPRYWSIFWILQIRWCNCRGCTLYCLLSIKMDPNFERSCIRTSCCMGCPCCCISIPKGSTDSLNTHDCWWWEGRSMKGRYLQVVSITHLCIFSGWHSCDSCKHGEWQMFGGCSVFAMFSKMVSFYDRRACSETSLENNSASPKHLNYRPLMQTIFKHI